MRVVHVLIQPARFPDSGMLPPDGDLGRQAQRIDCPDGGAPVTPEQVAQDARVCLLFASGSLPILD